MNLEIGLPNPDICFNCICECHDAGHYYCSMGYWDWESRIIAWYNEDSGEAVVGGNDPTDYHPDALDGGVYMDTTSRPQKCMEENGV